MRLHCFFNLHVLLLRLFFKEEVTISRFLLASEKVFVLVHEVDALGERIRAVVVVVLLVRVKRLNQRAKYLLHLAIDRY
jgi:hypothetical protein